MASTKSGTKRANSGAPSKQTAKKSSTQKPSKPSSKPPARPATKKTARTKRWRSRAVSRIIDAGNSAYCAHCDLLIKFRARIRAEQIICNVYINNKWDRVEHYHSECYEKANSPYGEPNRDAPSRISSRL